MLASTAARRIWPGKRHPALDRMLQCVRLVLDGIVSKRYSYMTRVGHLPGVSSRLITAAGLCCFIALFSAGCGSAGAAGARAAATASPTLTATISPSPTATHASVVDCATINLQPMNLSLPLPPNTVSYMLGGGTAGAGFSLECTPNMTQSAIVSSLNTGFQQVGWVRWDPASDNAGGCGTQPNDYWQWTNHKVAVGWDFHDAALPEWHLMECSLAYAGLTPTP